MLTDLFRTSSILALTGMTVSLAAVGMAVVYAIKPNEERLALMRPLSLAAIFGGLGTFTLGLATSLQGIAATASFTVGSWRPIAAGAAESLIGLFVAFGCLTIAWLMVTLGLRRASRGYSIPRATGDQS